jgi:membrane protease YdiL (CAAX protease family)
VDADLLRWEVVYAVQFVALEFFFRGFLVHGLKHRFGVYSVLVMTVPYCMIHFGKPMPEATASIIAGVALGLVSLATRSIWLGAALHISVAWGMDAACLARRGLFG